MLNVILFTLIGLLFVANILVVNIFALFSESAGSFSATYTKKGAPSYLYLDYKVTLSGSLEYIVGDVSDFSTGILMVVPSGTWQIACDIDQDYIDPPPDPNLAEVKHIHEHNSIPAFDVMSYFTNSSSEPSQYVSAFKDINLGSLSFLFSMDSNYTNNDPSFYLNLITLSGGVYYHPFQQECNIPFTDFSPFIGSEILRNDSILESVEWTINPIPLFNQRPIANAGQDQEVRSEELVSLDGSQSLDPDNREPIKYIWSQIGGPAISTSDSDFFNFGGIPTSVSLGSSATFTTPSVTTERNLTFQLFVTDGFVDSPADTVVVKVCPNDDIGTASTGRLSTTQLSCDDDDNEPVLDVEVNPPEINPYPPAPFPILSGITITAKNTDGTPASGVGIKVESCVKVGSATTDGHIHDNRNSLCIRGDRPYASLVWNTLRDNPITVTTDNNGIAKITYFPPKTTIGSKTYYISGVDQIVATLVTDPSINDDSKTITIKVPDLQPMSGSDGCRGGGTFFFERQSNHGCIFYDTPSTNDAVKRIADNFTQKQIDCRDSPNNQCTIIDDKGKQRIITIKEEPKPIKITAMNLPWGGLLDIGPGGCKTCKFWNPPHKSHNTGKELDIGFGNLKLANGQYDMDRIHLLRYVSSLDPNFKSFVSNEGGNIAQTMATTAPHIHIYFKN